MGDINSEVADFEKQLSDIVTGSGIHNREEVALLKDKALDEKDLQSRQDMQIILKQLITRLGLGKHPDDLPDCEELYIIPEWETDPRRLFNLVLEVTLINGTTRLIYRMRNDGVSFLGSVRIV